MITPEFLPNDTFLMINHPVILHTFAIQWTIKTVNTVQCLHSVYKKNNVNEDLNTKKAYGDKYVG